MTQRLLKQRQMKAIRLHASKLLMEAHASGEPDDLQQRPAISAVPGMRKAGRKTLALQAEAPESLRERLP